jgi:hygromycin-B 7''-O-kinase
MFRLISSGMSQLYCRCEHASTAVVQAEHHPTFSPGNTIRRISSSNASGNWRVSGLIDFGDVMTGWGEYDLLGPSAFMTAGMPGRVANLFRGFGYSGADLNPALTRRAGATALAHFPA